MSFKNEYHSLCGSIHLYHGDNRTLLENGLRWDIGIADPPYGINAPKMRMGTNLKRKGKNEYPSTSTATRLRGRLNDGRGKLRNRKLNQSAIEWDNAIPEQEYFDALSAVTGNQIIWGGNYFPLPPSRCWFVWDKLQPWENFSQFELAWTSYDKPAALFRLSNTGGANAEPKIHPTQKPVRLYAEIIRRFVPAGATIIDTHGGSFSIAHAVYNANLYDGMNLTLHAIEISDEYYAPAVEWFQQYEREHQSLFDGQDAPAQLRFEME